MATQVLLLELNEISFDYVLGYCGLGLLPNLGKLIEAHGIIETRSEQRYEFLEPWIQWVTAHTGLSYEEHGVFRLGDIVQHDIPQIWEVLEQNGLRVGAISPMNGKNRLRNAGFFVPDPWTKTPITAGPVLTRLYNAIVQAVNDNAASKVTPRTLVDLIAGMAVFARRENYSSYVRLALSSRGRPWRRAMVLDHLLSDVFICEVQRTKPSFASLFLNAGAHIQHHYLFCSQCYRGEQRNPDWYAGAGVDPVREVYEAYDRVVGQVVRQSPAARIMIATGLHQVPHREVTFYWRLRDHHDFLRRLGVDFERCEARMSRDFLVTFSDEHAAKQAAQRLSSARVDNGAPLFEVDNRGRDLFVTMCYAQDISTASSVIAGSRTVERLAEHVAFVALKNGEHHGTGYLIDTACQRGEAPREIALADLPHRVAAEFNLSIPAPSPHCVQQSPQL